MVCVVWFGQEMSSGKPSRKLFISESRGFACVWPSNSLEASERVVQEDPGAKFVKILTKASRNPACQEWTKGAFSRPTG